MPDLYTRSESDGGSRTLRTFAKVPQQIVSEVSASYDGSNVQPGAIPADHINMVKFKSREDVGYRRVLGWIREIQHYQPPPTPRRE